MRLCLAMLAPVALGIGCGTSPTGADGGVTSDAAPDGGSPGDDAGPGDGGPPDPEDGGPPDATTDGGGIIFTGAEVAIIATLSPLPELPPDPTNAYADDPAAAALGHALFFDARYSGPLAVASDLGEVGDRGRVACASCHSSPVMSDARSVPDNVSLGANFHSRNAPAIVNSAYYPWTNWGGRFSAQWELPPVVAEAPIIMNSTRLEIAHHIFDHYRTEYEAVFGAMEPAIGTDLARFPAAGKPKAPTAPDGPWELMTPEDRTIVNRIFINYGKAIQAYQRQLVSRDSDFDRFVAGDDAAIDESARRGLRVFMGSGRCVSCHSGPAFSDGEFHNIAVPQSGEHVPASDDGRFKDIPGLLGSPFNAAGVFSDDPAAGMARLAGLTNPAAESMRGAFRTPTLRDLTFTGPYMHSGQMATLEDVITFYDTADAVPVSGTRDSLMLPLGLTEQEQTDLLAFLDTLTSDEVPVALRSAP
ncbi:MAG: hypothetical protein M3Y87_07725 [Myxococcota bacterium]|nr:hypothetical protein [Myxococcota bacterium]